MSVLTAALNKQLIDHQTDTMLVSLADGKQFSGRQVANLVAQATGSLAAAGFSTGDVILLALTNSVVYPILEQAIWEIGAVAHPIAPSSALPEIEAEFADYGYAGGIFDEAFVAQLAGRNDLTPVNVTVGEWTPAVYRYTGKAKPNTEYAVILNTSGSTGKPKRVGLTAAQLLNSASHIGESQQLSAGDATLTVMPIFHVNAQVIQILATRVRGGKLIVAEKFSASRFWDAVADYGVTWVSIVPTIIQILQVNEKAQAAFNARRSEMKIKYVRSASFSLPVESLVAFKATYGIPVIEGYGMTEAASLIALNPFNAPKSGTVGLPVATDVALLVDETVTTAAHVAGEILLRGDHVISDYADPIPQSFHNGWLRTGDVGQFDEDGYLSIVGRIKEIISRGGEKVAPVAIESVLRELPFIEDVVVVGLPDALYGEEVTAAVILPADVSMTQDELETAIFARAAESLSKPARPTKVVVVTDYPRNPMGKVMRHKLVEALQNS
jgi:acyl-CoA synthetase (AMP-forming)/AMP-acid ligase II